MPPTTMSRGLQYLILLGDEIETRPAYLTIKDDESDMGQLAERIYAENKPFFERHGVSQIELTLYKPIETLPIGQLEHARSTKLEEVDFGTIQSTFGTGRLDPNLVHLVVKAQGLAQTRKRKRSSESLDTRYNEQVLNGRKACAPSLAAKDSHIGSEQQKYPLYNGRPAANLGPPLVIYHEVFAKLKDDLDHRDNIQPDADLFRKTHELVLKSTAFYSSESDRMNNTKPLWEGVLNQGMPGVSVEDNSATGGGIVLVKSLNLPGKTAVTGFIEWKQELGSMGNAGYQAACTYRKYVTRQTTGTPIRDFTCCPCLIIGIMGPYFCIMGAAFTDILIVEPFTDWIFLGGKPEGRIADVTRIFQATATAFSRLETYYQNITFTPNEETKRQARLPVPIASLGSPQLPSLSFIDRLLPARQSLAQPLFRAKMNGVHVVVKFADQYCDEAHKLLADVELAPKLYFCGKIRGGLYMVVMDYVEGVEDDDPTGEEIPRGAIDDVARAISLLHERNLVFGDLRRPNILVVGKDTKTSDGSGKMHAGEGRAGAVLIDFDWCEREGTARYPLALNDTGAIEWAEGVKRGGLIEKGHDTFRLDLITKASDP